MARRVIAEADVVLHDALVHPAVLALARPDAEILFAGKRGDRASTTQDEINHTLLWRARQGRRVARLKGGDPFVFGRGAEEALFLAEHGVDFEIVPGVSAALGATAFAGIPLTHRDHASSVAFVTSRTGSDDPAGGAEALRAVAHAGTLVIYMGLARIDEDLRTLVEAGRDPATPAAVISCGTHPEQVVVTGTLGNLAEQLRGRSVPSPAITVVGVVVGLRSSLRWWDRPGLCGRTVVIGRAADERRSASALLEREGAVPVEIAMIRLVAPTDAAPFDRSLGALADGAYDAVAFTSGNAVRAVFDALRARSRDARVFGRSRVVAVGPETAAALAAAGIVADAVPSEHRGAAVVASVDGLFVDGLAGRRVLLPRAEVAGADLPDGLRARGAVVDDVAVYRNAGPDAAAVSALRDLVARGGADAMLLTAGSVARNLVDALGHADALRVAKVFAAIGPSTAEAAAEAGIPVAVRASVYTVAGLVDALRDHFRTTTPPEDP